jgi:hypothetical protein
MTLLLISSSIPSMGCSLLCPKKTVTVEKVVTVTQSCVTKDLDTELPVVAHACGEEVCMDKVNAANMWSNVNAMRAWIRDTKKACTDSAKTDSDEASKKP